MLGQAGVPPKKGASLNRGRSIQEVETPEVFLNAIRKKLSIRNFTFDLAASASNCVSKRFYSIEQNSLVQPWDSGEGYAWCNPPYDDLAPWVAKGAEAKRRGQRVVMLVRASVGANWWRDSVHDQAQVWFLNGRITFVGQTQPYPSDLAILIYAKDWPARYCIWRWQDAPH